ncbi:MAG: class I SAM-dependent methyltransferase [Telluria sp.]
MIVYFISLLNILTVGLLADLVAKVRRLQRLLVGMYDLNQADAAAMFKQLEALQGLYIDLGFKKSLPPTRGWAASPDFLMELARHALDEKPAVVVECSSGTSTLILARCMQINGGGKVYSLEHDARYAQETRAQLERHGLAEYAQVLFAPLNTFTVGQDSWQWYVHEVLPPLAEIDMIAIDGPPKDTGKLARYPAGPALFPRLSRFGAVFLDDAKRDDEKAILARWKREFPRLLLSSRDCEKGCAVLRLGMAH